MIARVSIPLFVVVVVASLTPARAEDVETSVRVVAGKDPKAPQLEVDLSHAGKVTAGALTLTMPTDPKLAIHAASVRDYQHSSRTLALALVVSGQEIWVGNDDVEKDPAAKHSGALKALVAAIDKAKLGALGPAGNVVVISYSQGATIKLPMGKLARLTGAALGTEKDYRGKLGNDLVQGITVALAELAKTTASDKALIVIGDGNDTNNDAAKAQLAQLKKDALTAGVSIHGIIYKSAISDPGDVITKMIPKAKTVNSTDGFASELTAIGAKITDHAVAVFPGTGLPWDGKAHELVLKIGDKALDPTSVVLAPK